MFNLTHLLTYLQAHILPTASNISLDHLGALDEVHRSEIIAFFLVSLTVLIIFTISEYWDLGERDEQRQQENERLAALEIEMMDLESRLSPVPGPDIGGMVLLVPVVGPDMEGRILPQEGPPELDEYDSFMLPPPVYGLHEEVDEADAGGLDDMCNDGC